MTIRPEDIRYINQNGVRWALRQILIHNIKPGFDRFLLTVMALHADADGMLHPTQDRLAELTGSDHRCIRRSIKTYVAGGIMEVTQRQHRDLRFNTYRLLQWSALEAVKMDFRPDSCACENSRQNSDRTPMHPIRDSDRTPVHPIQPEVIPSERAERTPVPADRTPATVPTGLLCISDRTPMPHKDSIEDSSGDSKEFTGKTSTALRAVSASPPPHAMVVEESGPGGRTPRKADEDPVRSLPRPGDLVAAYDDTVAGSPLVALNRPPTRAECIALTQAIKHPALAGNFELWKRYCRWATTDRWLRGERENGYPGTLTQLCRYQTIDRWATNAMPVKRDIPYGPSHPDFVWPEMTPVGKNGEHSDPNRQWNSKTQTWDYLFPLPPGFYEAVEAITITGPEDARRKLGGRQAASPGPGRERLGERGG